MNLDLEATMVQLVLKLTLVLFAAWLGHVALTRCNPRWQVWLWRVTAVGLAGLLLAAVLPPLYGLPLLPPGSNHQPSVTGNTLPVEPRAEPSPAVTSREPAQVQPANYMMESRPGMAVPPPAAPDLPGSVQPLLANEQPVTVQAESGNGWRFAVCAYYLVLSVMLLRLTVGMVLAWRAFRLAEPAPEWVQAIARQWTQTAGCASIAVGLTDRFVSPVLIGVWRPMILLPQAMLHAPSAQQDVRGAIAHEAAHAAGYDPLWDLVLGVLTAFLWPHPLAWRVRAAHRGACERVSDRLAADFLGDVAAYQGLLARIALRVSAATAPIGLAMARRAEVRERLAALVTGPDAPSLGRRAIALAVGVTVVVLTLGLGSLAMRPAPLNASPVDATEMDNKSETAAKAPPQRKRPEALRFTVLRNDTNAPVPKARVTVRMYDSKPNVTRELTTDANGTASFAYPDGEEAVYLQATIRCPGLVPYYVNFGRNLIPTALPTEKTIRMAQGKKIGGKVVDAEGNPVAGAQLSITMPATDSPSSIHYHLLYEPTALDGTWELDGAPLTLSGLHLSIEHPRFIPSSQPIQDRLDGRYVLEAGLKLTGRITDRAGKPISGARVIIGRDRWGSSNKPVKSKADGTYLMEALQPHSTWVTAEAPGFTPQVKPVELDRTMKPVDFQLEPGHTTRFKVVNQEGEPLAGAWIVADTWKGFRSLTWEAKTDREGTATWNGAPAEAVTYHLLCDGYAAVRDAIVAPRSEPHLVQMPRPLRIQGIVTNARQEKIPEFRIGLGRKLPGRSEVTWIDHEGSTGRNGKFAIEYTEACDALHIRIEAVGYRPWTSEPIPFQKGDHKVFVRLQPGSGPAGIVRSPDNQPVAGAQLTLVTQKEGMQFLSGYRPMGGKQTVVSDQNGRFEFMPLEEDSLVVAVHDRGYAEIPGNEVAKAGGIRLEAWAKLDVVVRRGDQPHPNAKVAIQLLEEKPRQTVQVFSYGITGTTDAQGRVTIDRIVPRKAAVCRTLEQPIGTGTVVYPERSVSITLTPGAKAHVELGGGGAAVLGQLVVPGTPPANHQWSLNDALTLSPSQDNGNTDYSRSFRALIDRAGRFRADDIPPGQYRLQVNLTAVPDPNQCGHGVRLGSIDKEIKVPAGEATVDLGVIEGSWLQRLGAGSPAPLFVAQGVGSEVVRLGELRGRLVLLDFWATWCQPCLAEMPALALLHKEFAADARFQLVGLSLDNTMDDMTKMVRTKGWPWLSAFAGPGTSATIPGRYEVQAIPEKFLIDVNGTILYRGRDLDEISRLIRKRLSELPANVAKRSVGIAPVQIDDQAAAGPPIAVALVADNLDYGRGTGTTTRGAGLLLWSSTGKPIRQLDTVGTSGWLTGPQRLAIDAERGRLYYCDTLHNRLVALDRTGRQLFASPVADLHAAAVDERTGDIWCLATRSLNNGELLILDSNGLEKTRHPIAGFGLAYSPAEDAFWIVGSSIAKVSRTGKVQSTQPLPAGGYTFTDVAVNREQGGAWVLEENHPDVPASQLRLWKVNPDGTAAPTHRFPEKTIPTTLTCLDGRPWVTTVKSHPTDPKAEGEWALQVFSLDGTPARTLKVPASDLAIGVQSKAIWARTSTGLVQLDQDGRLLQTIPLSPDCRSVQIGAF